MKIKNIDNLTLAECQEYMATNPNGENAQEVLERMEHLLKFKKEKQQEYSARKTHDFNTEFNRYYATQRYEEAFAICLQYMNDAGDKATIIEKAGLVIPKLKNRILLPSTVSVSYDWLIDQLVLKGYGKMKYDGNSLNWKMSLVRIFSKGTTTGIVSKCRINLLFRIVVLLILCFMTVVIWAIGPKILIYIDYIIHYRGDLAVAYPSYYDMYVTLLSVLSVVFFIIWISIFVKMSKQHRCLLCEIANIIVGHISK